MLFATVVYPDIFFEIILWFLLYFYAKFWNLSVIMKLQRKCNHTPGFFFTVKKKSECFGSSNKN